MIHLLRGEDLEMVSRDLEVTAATLTNWLEAFMTGGDTALKARPGDDRDERIKRLEATVGRMAMERELLDEKIRQMEGDQPLGRRRPRR